MEYKATIEVFFTAHSDDRANQIANILQVLMYGEPEVSYVLMGDDPETVEVEDG